MLYIALALIFAGISCMFFCLWRYQSVNLKLLQEEHHTTRRHIERLNVRCATLSAQLDNIMPIALKQIQADEEGQALSIIKENHQDFDDLPPLKLSSL